MNSRNRASSPIGEQDGHAVGRLYADSDVWVASDGDVGIRTAVIKRTGIVFVYDLRKRFPSPFSRFKHVGAVHLTHADEGLELNAQRVRQILPPRHTIGASAFQFQPARAEAMMGDGAQGPAQQRRSPGLLHPFKLAVRLWK